jgi:hypothetical protein
MRILSFPRKSVSFDTAITAGDPLNVPSRIRLQAADARAHYIDAAGLGLRAFSLRRIKCQVGELNQFFRPLCMPCLHRTVRQDSPCVWRASRDVRRGRLGPTDKRSGFLVVDDA